MENKPEIIHTKRATLTLPVSFKTPVGLTKIPEPIIEPTITVIPFINVIFGLSVTSSFFFESSSTEFSVISKRTLLQLLTNPRGTAHAGELMNLHWGEGMLKGGVSS